MDIWSVDWDNISSFIQAGATIISTTIAIVVLWRQHKQAERLKVLESDLDKANFEHQTRFAKLHEKRGDVVAEVYRQVVILEIWLHHVVGEAELPDEAFASTDVFVRNFDDVFAQISINLQKLAAYFNLNRLYLDEELCQKLVYFHDTVFDDADPIYGFFYKRFNQLSEEELVEIFGDDLDERAYEVLGHISDLRRTIESEFRYLLGIYRNTNGNLKAQTEPVNDLMHIPEPRLIDPITRRKQNKETSSNSSVWTKRLFKFIRFFWFALLFFGLYKSLLLAARSRRTVPH